MYRYPTDLLTLLQDQINWFLQQSCTSSLPMSVYCRLTQLFAASIDPIERPFTPDTAKDIGSIWERQGEGQVAPNARRLAKPNALMFFHIPLYVIIEAPCRPHHGH